MKKKNCLILLLILLLSCLCANALAQSWIPGVYTGTANGKNGPLTVKVTVTAERITFVEIVEHQETEAIAAAALKSIPAIIVAKQSLDVDTVSGATQTSKAILAATENALMDADAGAGGETSDTSDADSTVNVRNISSDEELADEAPILTVGTDYSHLTTPFEELTTFEVDGGNFYIKFTGGTPGEVYRVSFFGIAIDGTAFERNFAYVGGNSQDKVSGIALTDQPGMYGPVIFSLTGDGKQLVHSFYVRIPEGDMDPMARNGVLNHAYLSTKPSIEIVAGNTNAASMQSEHMRLLSPGDGSVVSGPAEDFLFSASFKSKSGDFSFLTDTRLSIELLDAQTEEVLINDIPSVIPSISLYVPKGTLTSGMDYIVRITAGDEIIQSRFTFVEEAPLDPDSLEIVASTADPLVISETSKNKVVDISSDEELAAFFDSLINNLSEGNFTVINTVADRFDTLPDSYTNIEAARLIAHAYTDWGEETASSDSWWNDEAGNKVSLTMWYDNLSKEATFLRSWVVQYDTEHERELTEDALYIELLQQLNVAISVYDSHSDHENLDAPTKREPIRYNDETRALVHTLHHKEGYYSQVTNTSGEDIYMDFLLYQIQTDDEEVYEDATYLFACFMLKNNDGTPNIFYFFSADQALTSQIEQILSNGSVPKFDGQETTAEEVVPSDAQVKIRDDGGVNVRKESNSDSAKVGTAKAGATYPLLSVADNGWYEIQLSDGTTGYVSPKMSSLVE